MFFEPKSLEKSYEKFQIIFHNIFLDNIYFTTVLLLLILILVFYSPTMLILFCQYVVLGIHSF